MPRIIKLHLNLVRYIILEAKKKPTIPGYTKFLLKLGLEYLRVILNEYRRIFFPLNQEYRKQKRQYEAQQKTTKDLKNAVKVLRFIINKKVSKMDRTQKRRFLRDFYTKAHVPQDLLDEIHKETGY